MRHFIASGLWFLHDAPANRVAGTLHYSERGLHLKLLGSLRGGWSPKIDPYSLIYGVVSKNPYGEFVTLIDCFTKKNKLSSAGIGSGLIYCNRGILRGKHLPLNHDEFEALNLRLSYLSDWFGRKGITSKFIPGEQFGLEIRYRKPEPARLLIYKKVVSVGLSENSSESSHKLILTEKILLLVKPIPHFTADQIHSAYVR